MALGQPDSNDSERTYDVVVAYTPKNDVLFSLSSVAFENASEAQRDTAVQALVDMVNASPVFDVVSARKRYSTSQEITPNQGSNR